MEAPAEEENYDVRSLDYFFRCSFNFWIPSSLGVFLFFVYDFFTSLAEGGGLPYLAKRWGMKGEREGEGTI